MDSRIKPVIIVFIVLFVIIVASQIFKALDIKPLAGVLGSSAKHSFNFGTVPDDIDPKLAEIVEGILKDEPGDYAVVIKDLSVDGKKDYYHNDNVIYPAGSLYKLFLLAAAMRAVEQGSLTPETVISAKQSHLEEELGFVDFGYEKAKKEEVLEYTLAEILQRIATISDNYASLMLAEKLGWDAVQAEAKILGAKATIIKSPISTTPEDIANYFEKLYTKQVVSTASSDKIIELLLKSKLNDRIPTGLPEGIKVAHKTGELSRIRHDAGIVYLENNPYIIVLMSKGLPFEDDGVEVLGDISKRVYEYYNHK